MTDYLISAPHHIIADADTDRDYGHHLSMSCVAPSRAYTSRASADVLWTITDDRRLLIRTTTDLNPDSLPDWVKQVEHHPTPTAESGDQISVRVDLAALRSPRHHIDPATHTALKASADGTPRPPGEGLAYRVNKVPVNEHVLDTWAIDKIDRHGLHATTLTIQWYRTIRIPRRGQTLPVARVHATGTVNNPDIWNRAVTTGTGLGKGKPWGTGTIINNTTPQ